MEHERDRASILELIRRAQAQDHEAFGILASKYRPQLETLIHVRLGPRLRSIVEAEDVIQETYLSAFTSLRKFEWRGNGSFIHWLRSIAENVIRNLDRRHFKTQ